MTVKKSKNPMVPFVFFGTPHFAVFVLEELERAGMLPSLVITAPDKKAGRGMKVTPPPVKVWAERRGVPVSQPEKLDSYFLSDLTALSPVPYTLFLVAAYGKIIPQTVLDIPKYGALNVHPSLLPKYRGASPLQSAILSGDEETGVTIMLMDDEMDHGGIVKSEKVKVESMNAEELGEKLFRIGGEMLVDIMPRIVAGDVAPVEQDHSAATYTKKIAKSDGLIDLADDPLINWRKFRAYHPWPGTYFFTAGGARVKINDATFENGAFIVKKVIPEGKKEIAYEELSRKLHM